MLVSFVCLRFNWLFQISILLFFFFSLLFYISHFFSLCRVCYLLFLLYISSDSFNGLLPVEPVINLKKKKKNGKNFLTWAWPASTIIIYNNPVLGREHTAGRVKPLQCACLLLLRPKKVNKSTRVVIFGVCTSFLISFQLFLLHTNVQT
jgi:hypothetical protein